MTAYTDALVEMRRVMVTGGKGRITPEMVADAIQALTDAIVQDVEALKNVQLITAAVPETWVAGAITMPSGATATQSDMQNAVSQALSGISVIQAGTVA